MTLATSLLKYFESSIESRAQTNAAFKLGVLYGHVQCLNRIVYENDMDSMVLYKFEHAKSVLPKFYEHKLKSIVKVLRQQSNGVTIAKLLDYFRDKFYLDSNHLEEILRVFEAHGFVHSRERNDTIFFLSESGIRLAKALED